jgi:hypothetical protein
MATKRNTSSASVTVNGDFNFIALLASIAAIVGLFTRKANTIDNPVSQLYGNVDLSKDYTVVYVKDGKKVIIPLDKGYMPVASKSDSGGYQGDLITGKTALPPKETFYYLISYLLACMISGKIPSDSNALRGKILHTILPLFDDITLTVHAWTGGGNEKPKDKIFAYKTLKLFAEGYASIADIILSGEDKAGHSTRRLIPPSPSKTRKVEGL